MKYITYSLMLCIQHSFWEIETSLWFILWAVVWIALILEINFICLSFSIAGGMCLIIECSWYTSNKNDCCFSVFQIQPIKGGCFLRRKNVERELQKFICLFFHTWIALKRHKKQYKAIKNPSKIEIPLYFK